MARYFFDVCDASLSACDDIGIECPDQAVVFDEALRALCEIVADRPGRYMAQGLSVAVRDAADRVVLTAALNLQASWHGTESATEAARQAPGRARLARG
ncbi:DUF6894 family protein [Methylobacterium nigriterrae]|uniref:DUF6894 family protein n=1 Tax=Methylobacterium nigriterrae TaxID=3127512 RepID=UPI003013E4F5